MRESQQQRYRVIERLAAGGMAEVYRAESAGLEGFKKKVAIKRVLPHLAEKKRFISMFLDEARLGAHLSHSNCVQTFDVGVGDNTYFIVMEYVDGCDLKILLEWMRKANRAITPAQAVYITIKMCEGLAYAHALKDETGKSLQIVHRDISPPNVLITRFGEIKIVDFGLAKASSQLEKSEPGIIKGKFSYLSPEAATGQEIDHRTDIFAVGIILWEMLAGRKLFQGETDFDTVKQVQKAEAPSIRSINKSVDAALEQIIVKGLARDPNQRYLTAEDFGQALTRWLYTSQSVVSAFDIAKLVQDIVREKQTQKAKETGGAGAVNIIDTLIEQALFEFTSLEEGGSGGNKNVSSSGSKGLELSAGGFENLADWGSELSGLHLGSNIDRATPPSTIEGNLAALEEDDPPPQRRTFDSDPPPSSLASPSSVPPPGQAKAPPKPAKTAALAPVAPAPVAPAPAPSSGGGGKWVVVGLLVAAIAAAGAYFGGVFGK
jgi:eukaryotic-like serine/threonine-protein kinase